ncbi:MAG: tetratricopeptide repeat protein [Flavipsychrobacter sp.]|nr:tetratricopeptide repeat protein [Flavipsychrobacter sp.]
MRLPLFTYLALLLCTGVAMPHAHAQIKDPTDTLEVSKAGKNALNDAIYFEAIKAKVRNDDKQAIVLLEQYTAVRPDVAAAWYDLAKLCYKARNLERATGYIKKALELDKNNKWYKEQYASILADQGSYGDAAKIMADLSTTEGQDPVYLLTAAEYYERAKKYDEAIALLDKALAINNDDEEVLLHKMQVYLSMNNVEKAAQAVEQLIKQDPKNGKYYKLLGELYDNNKFPAKATDVYNRAKATLPNDPSVQLGIAEHYLKTGDSASYIAYVKKVIVNNELDAETQLEMLRTYIQTIPSDSVSREQGLPLIRQLSAQHPGDADVMAYYGAFLEENNQHDSAVWMYKKSLALRPANFSVWGKLLGASTDKQDADSLIKYSEKAMRLFPNQGIVHYYNGIGHINKKEYPAAIKAINRAIDMQPENDKEAVAIMLSTLADIYHSNKQDDLSDQTFEKALKLAPNDASLLNNYSYYLSERGKKLDEAEKMSKHSLELKPGEAIFLDTYGWILYKKGDYAKAKEYIQKAIDLAGVKADATVYDHIGDVWYKLNNKDKAIESWKISKQKGGDSPQLDKKISEGKLYE